MPRGEKRLSFPLLSSPERQPGPWPLHPFFLPPEPCAVFCHLKLPSRELCTVKPGSELASPSPPSSTTPPLPAHSAGPSAWGPGSGRAKGSREGFPHVLALLSGFHRTFPWPSEHKSQ